jgi:hypothetical protein
MRRPAELSSVCSGPGGGRTGHDGGVSLASFRCPFCGGALSAPLGTLGRDGPECPDCRRIANAPDRPYLGSFGAVEYEFDDVTPDERAEAADLLIGAALPYRWEDGYRLLVPPEHEDEVDVLFGQTPDDDGGAPDDGAPDDDGEPAEWVADEEAAQALAQLFDASDRLRHHPSDDTAGAELADAAGVVLIAPAPFGVNRVLWSTAGMLARQLMDLVETGADPDDVVAGADALRSVLREHV